MITKAKMLNYLIIVGVLMSAVPCAVAAMNEIGTEDHIKVRDKEALKDVLDSVSVSGSDIISSSDVPIYEFLTYANFGSDNSVYVQGHGAGGYEDKLYVAVGDYCYIYSVSIPAEGDPNTHPDNPEALGPMATRSLTLIGTYNFGADCGWSGGHSAEFHIDENHIYYGPDTYGIGGIEKWDKNPDGTFGAYLGRVKDKNGNVIPVPPTNGETFGYDQNTDTWYTCTRGRAVYSFDMDTDTSWQYEFTYPTYEGSHHDGLEFVNGFLWVSDMTTNWIGQWKKNPDGSWEEVARFYYDNPIEDDVEGMGLGPFGHLWVTGFDRLYEVGGKELGVVIEGIKLSMTLDKDEYYPTEMIKITAMVTSKDGSLLHPVKDKTKVKIDYNEVNIEEFTRKPNGEILIKVRAPSDSGEHTVRVQAETDIGIVANSTTFTVKTETMTGTVSVSLDGNVDESTEKWWEWYEKKYPTKYNAPVFRRGVDNPTFILNLDNSLPDGYEVIFEISDANDNLIATHRPTGKLIIPYVMNRFSCYWQWDTDTVCLLPSSLPIGVYTVNATVVDTKCGNGINVASDKFYVIFDFEKDDESFVTRTVEDDYHQKSGHGPEVWDTYQLHTYSYPDIWQDAIEWANGAVTTKIAVDNISELARRIDGEMVYHHANDAENVAFSQDEYDNDFDDPLHPDEIDENWNYNYEPYWFKPMDHRSGKAYNRSAFAAKPTNIWIDWNGEWVDGEGGKHHFAELADKMAWYFDTVKMLEEDFDPDNKVPDPHQHSVGVCEDYAMLTVAYLRAIGIPARSVTGWGYRTSGRLGHAWLQWFNATGDEEWGHLDTDHITRDSVWEANKYNPGYYKAGGITWNHVFVKGPGGILNITRQYNNYPPITLALLTSSGVFGSGASCDYEITNMPIFKPGENSTVELNITNPLPGAKTVNVSAILILPQIPIGGSLNPLTQTTVKVTIPANSEITVEVNLTVPGDASSGDYDLEIYEEEILVLKQATQVLAEYGVITEMPDEIFYSRPVIFSVTIQNNATIPIYNMSVMLDLHYYFNTSESLVKETPMLNASENHTFTWTLVPVWYGDLRIGVGVATSDAGSETKMVNVPVLQTQKLSITPTVPEKVEKGNGFSLTATVFNSGDIPSDAVGLTITTPPNVTANRTSVDLGVIGAHENKSWTFSITQDESEDFAILLNATSTNATTENYAFINIVQPNIFIDILKGDETPGVEQHTDVIETLADEPCSVTVYIRNTGDEKLSNVQILTNVNVTKDAGDVNESEILQVPLEFTPTTPGFSGLNVTVKTDEIEKNVTRTLLIKKFDFVVSIPKIEYNQSESVPINISVMNEVPSMRFIDMKIEINISSPTYNQTIGIPLLSLAPFVRKNITSVWDTTGVNNNTYTLVTSLMMADREVVSKEQYIYLGATMPPVLIDIADITAQSSRTATVPIIVNGMVNFGAATITLSYDPAVVQITSITAGDLGTPTTNIDNTAGTATIVAYVSTATGPDSPITLAILELSAVGSGGDTSPLTLAITTLADADGTSVSATAESSVFRVCAGVKGDLNGDGILTPADAAIALQIVVGSRPFDDAADVSGDGMVTSLDALMIMQAAAGAISL